MSANLLFAIEAAITMTFTILPVTLIMRLSSTNMYGRDMRSKLVTRGECLPAGPPMTYVHSRTLVEWGGYGSGRFREIQVVFVIDIF
jgi:hypothetical protein